LHEGNQVTDVLAKHGLELQCSTCDFDVGPFFISNALKADKACTTFREGI